MKLTCPVCKVPMTEKKLQSAAYFSCESHGVWATLAFFSKFKNMRTVAADIFQARRFQCTTPEEMLKCPQCFSALQSTEYKKVHGLILDQCFHCNGVWFDSGELNSIPHKAEFETDFKYRPLQKQFRTDKREEAKIDLSDGLPGDRLTPFMFVGLPAEESRTGPGVSIVAVVLCILALIFTMKGMHNDELRAAWGFDPLNPLRNNGLTIFTSIFLHTGWVHLVSNLYFLYITADDVEEIKGPVFLLILFFTSAIAGKFLYSIGGGTVASVGASGGVTGVMAYYAMAFPHNRLRFLRRGTYTNQYTFLTVPSQLMLFYYLGTQTLYYFMTKHIGYHSKTNFLAHLAGIAVGLIAYLLTEPQTKAASK